MQSTTDAVASHETQCKSVKAGDPGPNPAQATPRRELNLERPWLSAYFLCAFRQARRLAAMTWLVTYQAILAFEFVSRLQRSVFSGFVRSVWCFMAFRVCLLQEFRATAMLFNPAALQLHARTRRDLKAKPPTSEHQSKRFFCLHRSRWPQQLLPRLRHRPSCPRLAPTSSPLASTELCRKL